MIKLPHHLPLNCWDQFLLVEVKTEPLSIKPDTGQKIAGSLICTRGNNT